MKLFKREKYWKKVHTRELVVRKVGIEYLIVSKFNTNGIGSLGVKKATLTGRRSSDFIRFSCFMGYDFSVFCGLNNIAESIRTGKVLVPDSVRDEVNTQNILRYYAIEEQTVELDCYHKVYKSWFGYGEEVHTGEVEVRFADTGEVFEPESPREWTMSFEEYEERQKRLKQAEFDKKQKDINGKK